VIRASSVSWAFRTKVGTLGAFYGLRVIRLAMSMRFRQEKAAQYPQVLVDTKRLTTKANVLQRWPDEC